VGVAAECAWGAANSAAIILAEIGPDMKVFLTPGTSVWRIAATFYFFVIPNIRRCIFKRIGRFWSVRVGLHYRALAVERDQDVVWFWIGPRSVYNRLIGTENA